jgi:hypothetical protein
VTFVLRWVGHVAGIAETMYVHRILVAISFGKRPVDRPRRRSEDTIKAYVKDTYFEDWKSMVLQV